MRLNAVESEHNVIAYHQAFVFWHWVCGRSKEKKRKRNLANKCQAILKSRRNFSTKNYLLVASAVPSSTIIVVYMYSRYKWKMCASIVNDFQKCTAMISFILSVCSSINETQRLKRSRWLQPRRKWFTWYVVHDVIHTIHYTIMVLVCLLFFCWSNACLVSIVAWQTFTEISHMKHTSCIIRILLCTVKIKCKSTNKTSEINQNVQKTPNKSRHKELFLTRTHKPKLNNYCISNLLRCFLNYRFYPIIWLFLM